MVTDGLFGREGDRVFQAGQGCGREDRACRDEVGGVLQAGQGSVCRGAVGGAFQAGQRGGGRRVCAEA